MSKRKSYRASVERDGQWWFVQLPEIRRATQARRLDQVEEMARDLISLIENVPADSFDLEVALNLAPEISEPVGRAVAARGRAAAAQAEASSATRDAARVLTRAGLTVRDAGQLLEVSHQRVAQLLEMTPERTGSAVRNVDQVERSAEDYKPQRHHRTALREYAQAAKPIRTRTGR